MALSVIASFDSLWSIPSFKMSEKILQLIISITEITKDNRFSLESVRCLGACGLAPVVVIDHDTHASVNPVKTAEMLAAYE